MQIVEVRGEERALLDPVEQVVNTIHDEWVATGLEAGVAARRLRRALARQARGVILSEDFWGWLGC